MKSFLVGCVGGLLVGIAGFHITDWQYWMLVIWIAIVIVFGNRLTA